MLLGGDSMVEVEIVLGIELTDGLVWHFAMVLIDWGCGRHPRNDIWALAVKLEKWSQLP